MAELKPTRQADEIAGQILTTIGEYVRDCPEPLDFFDVIEALGKAGVRVMYQAAVEHQTPILTEEQFKVAGDLVSHKVVEALNEGDGFTPAIEMIGLTANLAYLAKWHNEKIKAYMRDEFPSSDGPESHDEDNDSSK